MFPAKAAKLGTRIGKAAGDDPRRPIQNRQSQIQNGNGGDDRIRTCGTLLEYNGLANRRFQPLSHVSEKFADAARGRHRARTNSNRRANFVKAIASDCLSKGAVFRLDTVGFCLENT